MTQPWASKRRYECQVCNEPLDAKSQADFERKKEQWAVLSFMHALGQIEILTCEACDMATGKPNHRRLGCAGRTNGKYGAE